MRNVLPKAYVQDNLNHGNYCVKSKNIMISAQQRFSSWGRPLCILHYSSVQPASTVRTPLCSLECNILFVLWHLPFESKFSCSIDLQTRGAFCPETMMLEWEALLISAYIWEAQFCTFVLIFAQCIFVYDRGLKQLHCSFESRLFADTWMNRQTRLVFCPLDFNLRKNWAQHLVEL